MSEEKAGEPVAEIGEESDNSTPLEGAAEGTTDERLPVDDLSPRHRRFAELLASGASNKEIKERMGFTDSWISTLRRNPRIIFEVNRIRERIYEDTIGKRLRAMADPALNEIERCLTDKKGIYKRETQIETAKWLIEKLDGKAVQKHDVGENVLAIVMDKLDSLKSAGKSVEDIILDVTPTDRAAIPHEIEAPKVKSEEDLLADWVISNVN